MKRFAFATFMLSALLSLLLCTALTPTCVQASELTKTPVSLSVTTVPEKAMYMQNQGSLDVTGGQITVTYDDDTKDVLSMSADMVSGFDNSRLGDQVLTVTYAGLTDTFEIYVLDETPAYSGTTGDLFWSLDKAGVLRVSGNGAMVDYSYNTNTRTVNTPWHSIRSNIKEVKIFTGATHIGSYAFFYCSSLQSVSIPDSVTAIGTEAFSGCSSLQSVSIPDSVTAIGTSAFSGCSSLQSVSIPDSVTSIGGGAFSDCSSLQSVSIPDSVTTIGVGAFRNCSSLQSVSIPDSVTSIGGGAFYGCSSLSKVNIIDVAAWCAISFDSYHSNPLSNTCKLYVNDVLVTDLIIPDSVTSIGNSAFSGCSSLQSVSIPDSVTSIGTSAFRDCSSLQSVSIPDSVTSIGNSAFSGCSSLQSVSIPDSVTSIGRHTFNNCSNLMSVSIPASVTSIGVYAFYGCNSLFKVNITNIAAWCAINFADVSSNPLSFAHNLYVNDVLVTDIVIPDSVTSIAGNAFYGCSSLQSVSIPDSVTAIGTSAFAGCSSLSRVNITDIAAWCTISFSSNFSNPLYYARNLYLNGTPVTNVTIPDTVTTINYTFQGCSSLQSVSIPDSVTFIGEDAFSRCSSLQSVSIPDSVTAIGDHAFYICSSLQSVSIPDSVTSIGEDAFSSCSSLQSVSIPDSVTSIAAYAFSGCSSLQSVSIPDSVTSIAAYAFSGCSSLQSVSIPDSVTSIEGGAFYGCSSLQSVSIPDSVTTIGSSAFRECSSLKAVTLPFVGQSSSENQYLGYIFGASSYSYNNNYVPKSLEAVILSKSCSFIEDQAFYGCSSLRAVVPGSVSAIRNSTFEGCSSLKTIVLPASVSFVGNNAFSGCSLLTDVLYEGTNAQKQNIAIGNNNTSLANADWHCEVSAQTINGHTYYYCPACDKYIPLISRYTVTFKNWDGSVIDSTTYHYGDTVTVPANPSRPADEKYTYTFAGWDKEVAETCTSDAIYTAVYDATPIDYTVTFKDWDGSVISTGTYHYGDAVTVPGDPSRPGTERYSYTFAGWDKEVIVCTGDAVYTATYETTAIFTDVLPGRWSYESVQYVFRNHLMNGVTPGDSGPMKFAPEESASRGMVATILYRLEGSPSVTSSCPFTDIAPGVYYEAPFIWASEAGIIAGYAGTTRSGAEDPITREQLATILYRYAAYKGYDTETTADLSGFSDYDQIQPWSMDALSWAHAKGLINGLKGLNRIDPAGLATREQLAAILHRFCTNVAGK